MKTRDALKNLLKCAEAQLQTPVCRAFVNPGANAPHDVCQEDGGKNGQLWVANLSSVAGWPAATALPITCAVPFAEQIEIGIVRCANSVLDDVTLIPGAKDITSDALQQQEDKVAIKTAILCCWEVDSKDMLPPVWEPIDPFGGCVGGVWTIYIRDATASCSEES